MVQDLIKKIEASVDCVIYPEFNAEGVNFSINKYKDKEIQVKKLFIMTGTFLLENIDEIALRIINQLKQDKQQ